MRTRVRTWMMAGVALVALAGPAFGLALAQDDGQRGTPAVPATTDQRVVVFDEEFDGTRLDTATWHTCHWWAPTTCTIETHDELGLDTANNVSVADGVLTLTARQEKAVGWSGKSYDYTTGMVSTGGSQYSTPEKKPGFVFRYGYAEARVWIPAGRGLVPAFWLAPADHSWPPEVDIMELLAEDPTTTNMTYHYLRANGTRARTTGQFSGPDRSTGWHTFAVDWKPGSLAWFIDGVERYRFDDPSVTDKPSYLLFTLAVGGHWPGPPDATTAFPAEFRIDWVRVSKEPLS